MFIIFCVFKITLKPAEETYSKPSKSITSSSTLARQVLIVASSSGAGDELNVAANFDEEELASMEFKQSLLSEKPDRDPISLNYNFFENLVCVAKNQNQFSLGIVSLIPSAT